MCSLGRRESQVLSLNTPTLKTSLTNESTEDTGYLHRHFTYRNWLLRGLSGWKIGVPFLFASFFFFVSAWKSVVGMRFLKKVERERERWDCVQKDWDCNNNNVDGDDDGAGVVVRWTLKKYWNLV